MSPGGLFSGALGFGRAAVEPPPPEDAPHAAMPSAAESAPAVTTQRADEDRANENMGATVEAPGHRPVGARSTPGQTWPPEARRPVRSPRVTSGGILIVEDDEAIASGLARVLDSQGYRVRRLARGGTATAAVTDDAIALVVLDLGLPDVDGLTVCRRLRAARPDLAILILTARDRELDVVAGLDAGADDYLIKPFRLAELLARVRAHLRRVSATAADDRDDEPLRAGVVVVDRAG